MMNLINILFFVIKLGLVKWAKIEDFDYIQSNGKNAINLRDEDELIAVS